MKMYHSIHRIELYLNRIEYITNLAHKVEGIFLMDTTLQYFKHIYNFVFISTAHTKWKMCVCLH